jgi:opacity protein-like surface antigen
MKHFRNAAFMFAFSIGLVNIAAAQESYISVFGGLAMKPFSANSGGLTSDFITGAGSTIPAGTELPSGVALGWNTEFDTGYNLGFAYGMSSDAGIRTEFEARYLRNYIDAHNDVTVAGIPIDSEDAGILITGSGNLGVTVGQLVADGRGNTNSWSFMANGYYDFNPKGMVNPYLGGGLGYATTEVVFEPSEIPVASDRDGGFAYQAIGGMDFELSEAFRLFGEYRYFGTSDVATELSLLPGELDIENRAHMINFGVRFHF